MKYFDAHFYRPPTAEEVAARGSGPVPAIEPVEAVSKTRATAWARAIAKEKEWRFLELHEKALCPQCGKHWFVPHQEHQRCRSCEGNETDGGFS